MYILLLIGQYSITVNSMLLVDDFVNFSVYLIFNLIVLSLVESGVDILNSKCIFVYFFLHFYLLFIPSLHFAVLMFGAIYSGFLCLFGGLTLL